MTDDKPRTKATKAPEFRWTLTTTPGPKVPSMPYKNDGTEGMMYLVLQHNTGGKWQDVEMAD